MDNLRHIIRLETRGAFAFDSKMRRVDSLTEDEVKILMSGSVPQVLPPKFCEKEYFLGGDRNFIVVDNVSIRGRTHEGYCISAPNRLYLELTRNCNLRCKMCYNAAGKPLPGELDTAEFFLLLDEMKRIGVFEARLTGGEPTTRPDFFHILDYAITCGFYVSLATNGVWDSCLTKEICKRNIDDVIISLEGPKEVNDAFRARGSYSSTMGTIRALKLAGFKKIRINTVLSRANWMKVEPLFQLCQENDLLLVDFIHPRPFGRGATQEGASLMLGAKETYEFNLLVERLRKKYPDVKVVMDFDLLAKEDLPRHPIVPRIHACPAGREFAFISPQGFVFPCGVAPVHNIHLMTPQEKKFFIAGNIREQSILDIWRNSPVWVPFRDLEKCKPAKCISCKYWTKKCFGTCPLGAYYESGRLDGEDPYCYSHLIPGDAKK